MTQAESKYFKTAGRMDEAFLGLMARKDFEYITVTEICKEAGVNRSTFYLHYETIGDLLSECVEHMNKQFLACFEESLSEFRRGIAMASLDQLFLITPKYLLPYLTYVAEHQTIFKVALDKPEVMQTDKTYAILFADIFDPILDRYRVPKEDRDYVLAFYMEGIMGIIKRWLLLDCKNPAEDIARIMMNVIRR